MGAKPTPSTHAPEVESASLQGLSSKTHLLTKTPTNMNSLAGRDEGRKPLPLVQQGTDTILHIDLVSTLSGDAFDPGQLTQLSATIQNDSCAASALIPVTIQDGALSIEITADLSRRLGTGYYTLTITGRAADSAYADGFRDYTIPLSLCRVTRSPAPSVPDKLTATVRDGLRGKDGKDAYEVAKAGGYQGSREAWLESLKGADGKSAYELAKEAQNFTGSLTEYLASLKGVNGKSAYQSYLDTTTDDPKLTEAEWADTIGSFAKLIHTITYGTEEQ